MIEQLPKQARVPVQTLLQTASRPAIVAVSGGCDSVFLLHLLVSAGIPKIFVAHLNHSLRGHASNGDARFVERLAKKLNCVFLGKKENIGQLATEKKIGLEEAGRIARWQFFAEAARQTGARALFLGHHGDDRAETLLHHLFRGAGLSGASTLRADSVQSIGRLKLRLLRPLLFLQRKDIERLMAEKEIPFREDASNASARFTRNRFRNTILPFLEKEYGRSIRATLARAARIFEDEDDWMEAQTDAAWNLCHQDATLRVAQLRSQPPALQRRLIRRWLKKEIPAETGFAEIESVLSLLASEGPSKINLPQNHHARRRAGQIFLTP